MFSFRAVKKDGEKLKAVVKEVVESNALEYEIQFPPSQRRSIVLIHPDWESISHQGHCIVEYVVFTSGVEIRR